MLKSVSEGLCVVAPPPPPAAVVACLFLDPGLDSTEDCCLKDAFLEFLEMIDSLGLVLVKLVASPPADEDPRRVSAEPDTSSRISEHNILE